MKTNVKSIESWILVIVLILSGGFSSMAQMQSKFADNWSDPSGVPNWTPLPPSANVLGPPDANCVGTSNAGVIQARFDFPSFNITPPILGIEVVVRYRSVVDCTLQLMKGGMLVGSSRVLPSTPVGASTCNGSLPRMAGGNSDLWGTSLTAADFNAGNISVLLTRTTGLDNPISLDIESVELIVYYGNSDPDCSGAAIATQQANASCKASISGSDVIGVTDPNGDAVTITVDPSVLSLGVNSVTVNASDGKGGTCSKVISVTVIDNTDPIISCPLIMLEGNDSGECSAVVTFNVTATDNCSVQSVSCSPPSGSLFPVGKTMVKCTATDGSGNTDQCSFNVIVSDTEDPVIDCSTINPNRTTDPGVCSFTMPGTGFDPTFSDNCPGAFISNDYNGGTSLAGATFPEGSTDVTWTVTDASGNTAQCVIKVNVVDDEPPVITTLSYPLELWPPNHKYHTILVEDCVLMVSDNCDMDLSSSDVFISKVSSDEPEDIVGNGDGNTTDDMVISDDRSSVKLRSERQGEDNGRVYTIHVSVIDGAGNEGTAICLVTVAHDKNGPPALDDGVSYQVNGDCSSAKLTGPQISFQENLHKDNFMLYESYPNPFSSVSKISFSIPEPGAVRLSIYDFQGQLIKTLHSGAITSGFHDFFWNGTNTEGENVAPGVYMYQLTGVNFYQVRKTIYIP